MNARVLIVLAAIGTVESCRSQEALGSYIYCAAMYNDIAGVSQELQVFPFDRTAFSLALPFPLGPLTYSPDGKALYATDLNNTLNRGVHSAPGLFKIEISPTRVASVPGLGGFGISGVAIPADQDEIVISGGRQGMCGIYKLSLPDGNLTNIVEAPCAAPLGVWQDLSLSPDGVRATAVRNHHLELIDLIHRNVEIMPDNLALGAWSPDGKWLAAMRNGGEDTILLDARTLEQRRVIGNTDLKWSPDSRYLLARRGQLACGPYAATLEIVDIETGRRTSIASSRCRIDRGTLGWVSNKIKP